MICHGICYIQGVVFGVSSDAPKFWRPYSKWLTIGVWNECLSLPCASSSFEEEEEGNAENEKCSPYASNYGPKIRTGGALRLGELVKSATSLINTPRIRKRDIGSRFSGNVMHQ